MGKKKELAKTALKKDSLKLEETSGKAKSDNHLEEDYIKAYQNRLAAHMDELKWLYYELYRSNEQSFNYFLSLLDKYAKERDPELRALDQERMKNPRRCRFCRMQRRYYRPT